LRKDRIKEVWSFPPSPFIIHIMMAIYCMLRRTGRVWRLAFGVWRFLSHWLPITTHWSPITDHHSPITIYQRL